MEYFNNYFNFIYTNEELIISNNIQDWNNKQVKDFMNFLHLQLENNAIIKFKNKIYYGTEDDYRIYFPMSKEDAIEYFCYILSSNMKR